jgi:hypothetical protein
VVVARRPIVLVENNNAFEIWEEELAFCERTIERQSFLVIDHDVTD